MTSTARPRAGSAAPISAACSPGSRRASRHAAPARLKRRSPRSRPIPALKLTLPAWAYHSEEFHELEQRALCFVPSWQVVCHASELPEAGDYVAFEFFGRRGFVVRGRRRRAPRLP